MQEALISILSRLTLLHDLNHKNKASCSDCLTQEDLLGNKKERRIQYDRERGRRSDDTLYYTTLQRRNYRMRKEDVSKRVVSLSFPHKKTFLFKQRTLRIEEEKPKPRSYPRLSLSDFEWHWIRLAAASIRTQLPRFKPSTSDSTLGQAPSSSLVCTRPFVQLSVLGSKANASQAFSQSSWLGVGLQNQKKIVRG